MGLLLLRAFPTDRDGGLYRVLPDTQEQESFVYPLGAERTILGRCPGVAAGVVLLPHPEADRKHAMIRHRLDGYYIEDSHSHNGTTINGEPLASGTPQKLAEGDRIGIVGHIFEFRGNYKRRG